jgi:hypothetical protein
VLEVVANRTYKLSLNLQALEATDASATSAIQ